VVARCTAKCSVTFAEGGWLGKSQRSHALRAPGKIIGPAHTCATPEPNKFSPPPSSGLRYPLSFWEKSYPHWARSRSNARRKFRSPSIAQMSEGDQQATGNINCWNAKDSFNTIFNFNTNLDDEGCQILQWLSPLEPQQRHQGVRADRLDGVGNWVLETGEFRGWSDAGGGCVEPVLFCYGNPGVGKTYVR